MALRGQHEHSLDAKDRITVPATYRAALSDGVVLMMGVEPCVEVWPAAAAEAMEAAWINPLSPMGADSRRLRRRLFSSSEQTELDSAGRVRLPKRLIKHASLSGASLVVGVGDHLEIWDPEGWASESDLFQTEAGSLTERLDAQGSAAGGSEGPES